MVGPPTLCSSVDHGLHRLWYILVDHIDERCVHPSAGLHRIQSGDDDVKLHVEGLRMVLDLAVVPEGPPMFQENAHKPDEKRSEATHAVTLQPGTRAMMNSAATVALGLPTSASLGTQVRQYFRLGELGGYGTHRKRNWRLRLETYASQHKEGSAGEQATRCERHLA